jgi:hypothetical protein
LRKRQILFFHAFGGSVPHGSNSLLYKNCTRSIIHTDQRQTTHQTIPDNMSANQPPLKHANDGHQPLTLYLLLQLKDKQLQEG